MQVEGTIMRKMVAAILGIPLILAFFPGLNGYAGRPRVTVYQHCEFKGYYVSLSVGSYETSTLRRLGMRNDDISSIRIPGGLQVILYQHDRFQGRGWAFSRDIACFGDYPGLNDTISSIRVFYR